MSDDAPTGMRSLADVLAEMGPGDDYAPPGEASGPGALAPKPLRLLFEIEALDDMRGEISGGYVVKGLFPTIGFGALGGAWGSLKTFVAIDLAGAVSEGRAWAGMRVKQGAVVYIAAEGASGMRNRRLPAYRLAHAEHDAPRPFYLIAAAPNLGVADGDGERLIDSIDGAGLADPLALIVVDTLAQTLGGADENGGGMLSFIGNAQRLAQHFQCFVLAVHHFGKDAERGLRGHSSLPGAVDAALLITRTDEPGVSTMVVDKNKDGEAGQRLTVRTRRVAIGTDDEGDEVSSLVVDSIEPETVRQKAKPAPTTRPVPAQARLFMTVLRETIAELGRDVRPFDDAPMVRAVDTAALRKPYYARLPAELTTDARKKAFGRALADLVQRQSIGVTSILGEEVTWIA
ncbi:MAG: AAA family ATPase [Alphaproteobacteria bacterium]|nr:AAA family ATPase [Alphaproteobacteria bacterium]